MADTLDPIIGKAMLCNTDTHDGGGIHWIVVLKISREVGYIFDPLGPKNPRVNSRAMPTTTTIIAQLNAMRVHLYPYRVQALNNSLCGWYSIYIARLMNDYINQVSPRVVTPEELDAVIESQFGKSATRGDIMKLARAFAH